MNNIFAGYGSIIEGDLYVQRGKPETALLNRTMIHENYGSVSVVGLNRMGKSTLVHNAVMTKAEEYYDKGFVIVKHSMDIYSNPESFFKGLADEVYEMIDDHGEIDGNIQKKYNKVQEASLEGTLSNDLKRFFKAVRNSGKRVLCVIDEFDHSRKLFQDYKDGFSILRNLTYEPACKVTFIFISRRNIYDLEKMAGISTLSGLVETVYVSCYSDGELDSYYLRSEKNGIILSDAEKKQVLDITGAQPYWMDLLMYHYVESEDENKDIEDLFEKNKGTFYNAYKTLLNLLKEQNLLGKLYQIVIGPGFDYSEEDVKNLVNYGVIKYVDGRATVFSRELLKYMQMKESAYEFYPLWIRTEQRMRGLLKYELKKKYGDQWENKVEEKYITENCHPMSLGGYLSSAAALRNKELKKTDLYIQEVSYTIVEALTTAGLFEFFRNEYDLLGDALQMKRDEFNKIAEHLTRARNPYSHSNGDLVKDSFKSYTKAYCDRLNERIDRFEKKRNVHL